MPRRFLFGPIPFGFSKILERFLHHAEIIQISGKSYRLRNQARQGKDADEEPKTTAPEKAKQATPEGGAHSSRQANTKEAPPRSK